MAFVLSTPSGGGRRCWRDLDSRHGK